MKNLMLAASALTLLAAPAAHAQILGGGGGLSGTLNGATNSTLRGSMDSIRTTTRGTLRGDAATRGDQNVDRRSGDVSVTRSVETGVGATAGQLLETPAGALGADASGSGNASGSGSANASLIGTDAVREAGRSTVGRARENVSNVRNLATPAVANARQQATGLASQAGNAAGSASGAASGAGSLGNGMLALAGSGAAAGEGAFAVTPGMPVELPSGAQLGTVRDIVATRAGQVREVVVQTRDGLTTFPAGALSANGNALVTGEADGSADAGSDEMTDE